MNIPYYYTPAYYAEIEREQAERSREKSVVWDAPKKSQSNESAKRYSFWRGILGRAMSVSEF